MRRAAAALASAVLAFALAACGPGMGCSGDEDDDFAQTSEECDD